MAIRKVNRLLLDMFIHFIMKNANELLINSCLFNYELKKDNEIKKTIIDYSDVSTFRFQGIMKLFCELLFMFYFDFIVDRDQEKKFIIIHTRLTMKSTIFLHTKNYKMILDCVD